MNNKILLAAFAILYQVSQSNSKVNEHLGPFQQPQSLEKTSYKETHDKYGEISIKREGGLKKIVLFSNKSNEATKKTFNAKKQKLHELRRLRISRSNETSVSSNKDIVKLRKFTTDLDLKYTAKSRSNENNTNENLEEYNSKIKSKEEFKDTNSSHEYMYHSHPISLSADYAENIKEINSSSGDQNRTKSYRDHRKQNKFRHLWGQDRSIHSYRSASMHKKPFWYSPYHFPRAKVTVAGLNIPWFRLRSTFSDKDNSPLEPVQLSKPDDSIKIQHNNTANLSTLAPIEIRLTNIYNIAEQKITPVYRTSSPSQMLITLQSRQPHWPNFYKNMDQHTSEKSFKVYKSVRVATKPESVETEKTTVHSKTKAWIAASVVEKTSQGHFNKNDKHANSRQHNNETTTDNTIRNSNPRGKDIEVTTVNDEISTNMKLQNVTPRVLTTTLKPIREPQWPPWPQWLNEPLRKNNNEYNDSYVLNEYTANVYSNNEKSVTLSSVKLNDAPVNTKNTEHIEFAEESEPFFDIASTYSGLTANIAALLPVTTGIRVTTTEANKHNDKIVQKSHNSENGSTLLPNIRNIVRCTQGCPLTPEFNPVCGTDDITYTNPGRLLCLQFCGLDVKVKKYQPCSSKHKLSEYPNMINLFINTAVESLRANASAPGVMVNASSLTPRATVKANHASTPSVANSTTVGYVRYDSFSMNDEDDDTTESKVVVETATEMTSRITQLTKTTVVPLPSMSVNRYMEKLKNLINSKTDYNKHGDLQSATTNGPSQVKDVTHSSKKIVSNIAALDNMLRHSGRDGSTKAVHAVTYSSRDVATKRFTVTRAMKDVSTRKLKINFAKNSRKSSSSINNLILKQGAPHVDALDSLGEPNNNGRRFVESPFVDLPYSSGEYVSPDENGVDIFQDTQKDSDDAGDVDSKFWGYQSEKEKLDVIEENNKVKEKTNKD